VNARFEKREKFFSFFFRLRRRLFKGTKPSPAERDKHRACLACPDGGARSPCPDASTGEKDPPALPCVSRRVVPRLSGARLAEKKRLPCRKNPCGPRDSAACRPLRGLSAALRRPAEQKRAERLKNNLSGFQNLGEGREKSRITNLLLIFNRFCGIFSLHTL